MEDTSVDREAKAWVFRAGALGDFILSLPALRAVRDWSGRMGVGVTLVGHPAIACLALRMGLVDCVLSVDAPPWAGLYGGGDGNGDAGIENGAMGWRALLRNARLGVSWIQDPDGAVRCRLESAGVRQVVVLPPKVFAGHAADAWVRPLIGAGLAGTLPAIPVLPVLDAWKREGQRIMMQLGVRPPVIALHPGSGGVKKNWPLERYLALAHEIQSVGFGTSVFSCGEADQAIERQLAALPWPVLRQVSVESLAAWLTQCRAFVGNDSGVTHLAAALGVPGVALFGPTDPFVWGPRGPHMTVMSGAERTTEALARIEVAQVRDVLGGSLADFGVAN